MVHFTWFDTLGVDHHNTYIAANLLVTSLLVVFAVVGRIALGSGEAAIQPAGSLSLKGFFEALVEMVDGMIEMVLGRQGRPYLPLFGSIFFFILVNNLMGLLPGMTAATSDLNTALAIGLFSFLVYNFIGIRKGGMHYLAHFLGPVWWLAPLMLVIELISHFVRPFSLGMRLSVNMSADHTVLSTFLDLTKFIVPVLFYGLGTFVSLVQAFVFTMLSMVYVMMATADDH